MRNLSRFASRCRNEKGAVAVVVALLGVVFMGFVALAVDVGYLYAARNELQNTADGAALAATRKLGAIYQGMTYQAQQIYDSAAAGDNPLIVAVATEVGTKNSVAGKPVSILATDVAIGRWKGGAFTQTNAQPDAVRVTTRRDGLANGPVTNFFAGILGIQTSAVAAVATAALSGQSTAGKGELELPIGISRWFFDVAADPSQRCNDDIQFHPSNSPDSCAGWTSFTYGSNNSTLVKILEQNEDYKNPTTVAGETIYNFTGGNLSTEVFTELLRLFQLNGFDVDANGHYLLDAYGNRIRQATAAQGAVPLYEKDNDGNIVIDKKTGLPKQAEYPDKTLRNMHKWETGVVIYDRGDCSNPNQSIKIVGFAQVEMRDVLNSPDKLIRGKVKCNYVDDGLSRGGGGEYGVKGSIPGLVE